MASQALVAGIASSLFFVVLNVAMNIYMKWLFAKDGGDFALPWTMLAVQQLQAFVVLQPWLAVLDPAHWGWNVHRSRRDEVSDDGKLSWFNLHQVLAVTVLFCLNVGLNSLSLVEISITLNQTIRAFLPVGVLFLATCIEQRVYPSHSYWTTVLLVGGIALTCWGSPNFQMYGFTLAFISTLVAALGTSLNGRLLSKGPFSKSGPSGIARLMMLQSLPAFFIFGLIAACTEGSKLREAFFDSTRWTWYQRVFLVTVSSALALLSNLGRCFLVAATSALMETLAGNAKVAALCAIDHQLFHTQLFPANYIGIVMTFLGFSIHVLLQYASKEPSPPRKDDEEECNGHPTFDGHEPLQDSKSANHRKGAFPRPRLISAADTGLAAEHVAVQMGRPQKNRSDSGDSSATGSSVPEHLRQRSMTWPAPRPQPEANTWMNVDMSLVWEVPSWLDPERAGRLSAAMPEDYSPLSVGGMSPSRFSGAGSPAARLAGVTAGMSPSARSRAHTDPQFQSKSRLLDDFPHTNGLMTVQEEDDGLDEEATNGGSLAIVGGPLPPPDLPYL